MEIAQLLAINLSKTALLAITISFPLACPSEASLYRVEVVEFSAAHVGEVEETWNING